MINTERILNLYNLKKSRIIIAIFIFYFLFLLKFFLFIRQADYYFDPILPLNGIFGITASFGEFRSTHFHFGIDMKTPYRKSIGYNYPISAIEDGYIYRILYSRYGYGKALYILHPNGTISIYAHLSRFTYNRANLNEILNYNMMRKKNRDFVSINFQPGFYKVKKGESIAMTGMSATAAPHLHFEIRDKYNVPINPFINKIKYPDNSFPVIRYIRVIGLNGLVNGQKSVYLYPEAMDTHLRIKGNIGIEASVYDRIGAENKTGIYNIKLLLNNKKKYELKFDRMSLSERNYNGFIYRLSETSISKTRFLYYCYKRKGLSSNFVKNGDGIIESSELVKGDNKVELIASDFFGNSTFFSFFLSADTSIKKLPGKSFNVYKNKRYYFKSNDKIFFLRIKPNTFYENTSIAIQKIRSKTELKKITSLYEFGDYDLVPSKKLRVYFRRIGYKKNRGIFLYSKPDKKYQYTKTEYSHRYGYYADISRIMPVALLEDLLPPIIYIKNDKTIYYQGEKIIVYIKDKGMGINESRIILQIDGINIFFIYNYFRKSIEIYTAHLKKGNHTLSIKAEDKGGNVSSFSKDFFISEYLSK